MDSTVVAYYIRRVETAIIIMLAACLHIIS